MHKWTIQCMVLSTCFLSSCSKAGEPVEIDVDAKLAQLNPLPKVHYSFAISKDFFQDRNSRRLYEYARITHALSVSGESATQEQMDTVVYTCARINKTDPEIACRVGVNYSPWHRVFEKELPPNNRGNSYHGELKQFSQRMNRIRQWVETANKKYDSDVKVGAILLDSERFFIKENDSNWNEAVRENLDAIHTRAQSVFPEARIEWYARGIRPDAGADGWTKSPLFTGKEKLSTLSCSLYFLPEMERTQELFRRTANLASHYKVKDVTPWVALASGYRRGLTKAFYWDMDWDYDLIYSYQAGALLNIDWYGQRPERFAPFTRAEVVVFYPSSFDQRSPNWPKHFIAYVRGATSVKDLSDLGYEK